MPDFVPVSQQPKVTKIDIDKVLSVYSGRPGCACGCRGNYFYQADPKLRAAASTRRGYTVTDDEVRSKKALGRIINNMLATGQARLEGDHVWAETETRLYIVELATKVPAVG